MSLGGFLNRRITRRHSLKAAGGSMLMALLAGVPWRPASASEDGKRKGEVLQGEDRDAAVRLAQDDERIKRLIDYVGRGSKPQEVRAGRVFVDGKPVGQEFLAVGFFWPERRIAYYLRSSQRAGAYAVVEGTPYKVLDGKIVVDTPASTTSVGTCGDCSSHYDCQNYDEWCANSCCGYNYDCITQTCPGACWELASLCIAGQYAACFALMALCGGLCALSNCCSDGGYHCVPMPQSQPLRMD